MPDAPFIPSPQTIADYPVLRELTPNTTYLADRAGRRVVLKRLEDDCLLEGELHPLIHDRLSRVRELAHVGVANLLAVELGSGAAYLVWEYVEGTPLADCASSFDPTRRGVIARDLIAAVETLHALGIVHGEIHGHNVIVTPSGRVKLTHVSPLLYNEQHVDVEAVAKLLREIGCRTFGGSSASLRQIAAELVAIAGDPSSPVHVAGPRESDRHDRRGSLLAAALLSVVAVAIAFGVWLWADKLSQSDELSPAVPPRVSTVTQQQGAN